MRKYSSKRKIHPATLLERQEILAYCLETTKHRAARLARLMRPTMDFEDIQSEVGVKVWKAMVKKEYLKKSKLELTRIGYVTAHNHVTHIVRARLVYKSHGASITYVPLDTPHVTSTASLLLGNSYINTNPIGNVLMLETIRNEAIGLVGVGRYRSLLKAIAYDWFTEELSPSQCALLVQLDYSQNFMVLALRMLSGRVKKRLKSEIETDVKTSKVNGMWVQNREAPRHVVT